MEPDAADHDPKGLIGESYRIAGISLPDCRTIFLDWALSLGDGVDQRRAIRGLLDLHEAEHPGHPMNAVLRDGLASPARPRRRGGWRSRPRGETSG